MDDSDLAGPICFCLLFGAFMLLVCRCALNLFEWIEREGAVWVRVWSGYSWMACNGCHIELNEWCGNWWISDGQRNGILLAPNGSTLNIILAFGAQRSRRTSVCVFFHHVVHVFLVDDVCYCFGDARSVDSGCLSTGSILHALRPPHCLLISAKHAIYLKFLNCLIFLK